MPNEFRTPAMQGGRVTYPLKAGTPTFDLAKEARKERAKMGGQAPPVQTPSPTKAKKAAAPKATPTPKPSVDKVGLKPPTVDEQQRLADEMEK